MRNIVKFLGVITLCLLISMSGSYVVNAETHTTEQTVVNEDGSTTTTTYGSELFPENPQTGVADYLLPTGGIVAAAGAALKVLKAKRFVKQF